MHEISTVAVHFHSKGCRVGSRGSLFGLFKSRLLLADPPSVEVAGKLSHRELAARASDLRPGVVPKKGRL